MPFQQVAFVDNAPVIELLAAKPYGLMNLLDEEVRVAHAGGGRAVAAGRWQQGGGGRCGGTGLGFGRVARVRARLACLVAWRRGGVVVAW